MIYTKLHGRLGNHLFEMAAAASLASKNGDDWCAVCHKDYILAPPDNCYIWDLVQKYLDNIYSKVKILEEIPVGVCKIKQQGFKYQKIEYQPNLLLDGGFQSYKYFDENLVKELFSIPETIKATILQKFHDIFASPVIAINVRRGDYCYIPHRLPVCSKSYFKKAMSIFPKKSRFVFISDDLTWCKKNFKGENIYFLENNDPLIDLYAQTLCTDNIISNSTFSWWGAYLNPNPQKKVIYPRPWFGKFAKNSISDVEDLIPPTWIALDNHMDFNMWLKAKKLGLLTHLGRI